MHKFGVWAPKVEKMSLQWRDRVLPLEGPNKRGWWLLEIEEAGCGDDYAFLVNDDSTAYPDPRSQDQPGGVHGPSRLYDHALFPWTDQLWRGSPKTGAIIYELHIGTFTPGGTFDSAIERLGHLEDLGITHVEVLPVASFGGRHGWGYDGVSLFAVHEPYGGPDGFKRFVDACHAHGLSVILDVVYNHFGPVGNYTNNFGPYLTDKYKTPWGDAVNLDDRGSDEVRRFFCDNAQMWLRDYHCDGLRFDAVHAFIDSSAVHFMEQLTVEVERLSSTLNKEFYLIAESDLNDPRVVRPKEAHGYGMDSQWSDDFHHALFTILYTKEPGRAYYSDFGSMNDLHKALKHAYVYDGQYSKYRRRRHGRPVEGLSAHHFVHFIQNHDQVGNRALGERLEHLCGFDAAKVALGLLITAPFVPMLFMGEEWATTAPFLYFADHEDEDLRTAVSEGRKREFAEFGYGAEVPNPEDPETFQNSKLRWDEIGEGRHAEMLDWVKTLIHLRRSRVALNDGSLHNLIIQTDDKRKTLTMEREEARILVNFGTGPSRFELLEGEKLTLASRNGLEPVDNVMELPGMSLAIVLSTTEEVEDRQVR